MILKAYSPSAGVPALSSQMLLGQIDKVCLRSYQRLRFHSESDRSHSAATAHLVVTVREN